MYPSQGVLNLVKYISYCLVKNKQFNKKYVLKIFIFDETFFLQAKKIIYNSFTFVRNLFLKEKKRIHKISNIKNSFLKENKILKNKIVFFSKKNNYKNFYPDLVFPLQDIEMKNNYKSLGYIYDLQHIDLPNYFKSYDKKKRNSDFKYLIENTDGILVNSSFVKNGVKKNFKIGNKSINVIPFLPYLYDENLKKKTDVKKKYNIKNEFFIICNHFWKHKNHQLAFKAFENLQKTFKNIDLVCTGVTHDSRFPEYFKNLENKFKKLILSKKIKILDLIPRSDQLELIKKSIGVIQPSLYEGGPGGFSAYEAMVFNKQLIISDLKINKEISYKNSLFYKKNSSEQLLKKMILLIKKKNNKEIIDKQFSETNKKKLANFFLKLFNKILND